MSTVSYPHVEISESGIPFVAGTQTKVVEIVLDRLAHHWDADEVQRQHPHLSLSQIYAALTYYHDHQVEIDRDIDDRRQRVDRIQASQGESPVARKLHGTGQLP